MAGKTDIASIYKKINLLHVKYSKGVSVISEVLM